MRFILIILAFYLIKAIDIEVMRSIPSAWGVTMLLVALVYDILNAILLIKKILQ